MPKRKDKPEQMKMDDLFKSEKVYSILELNTAVRDVIKARFPQYVWVCGEIQDMRPARNKGHIYFNCVQKDPDSDKTMAQVSAALFAGRAQKVFDKLKAADPDFKLKNDIEVKLLCQLDLYPKGGRFSIIVVDIDPVYTLGKIAQNRQKIISDLKKRELLDKNKEKEFPFLPLKIGLITAADSAAYHDFINELVLSDYGFQVKFFGAHMQGKLVEPDVLEALDFFNRMSPDDLDLIVVTRGGGSTADLSYFDSKKIAEKIAFLNFPVVAAVGHQINTTIIDLMAHTSCKTPTAAAQHLAGKVEFFLENLSEKKEAIIEISSQIVGSKKQNLQNTALRFDSAVAGYFRLQREILLEAKHSIFNCVKVYLEKKRNLINNAARDTFFYGKKKLQDSLKQFEYMSEKINLLDPRKVLKRGYSVTYLNGKALKDCKSLKIGDKIKTVFYQGRVESEVKKKEDRR